MKPTQASHENPAAGSNLKGAAAGASWTYLVDSLDLRAILCLGRPSSPARATLDRIANDVAVRDRHQLDPLPHAAFDLVWAMDLDGPDLETRVGEAAMALRNEGQLFLEVRGRSSAVTRMANAGLLDITEYWLTPARGEIRSAIPINDRTIREYFVQHAITVPSSPRPLRFLDRVAPVASSRHRVGLLARSGTSAHHRAGSLPRYVRDLAAAHGVDVSHYRFGLSARGRYNSRKVIFYLFAPGAIRPELIVKATRDKSQNARLENEEHALRHVDELGLVDAGTAPQVVFSGVHGGLKMVAETAIDGRLLSKQPSSVRIVSAYAWLTNLGTRSAQRTEASREALNATLEAVRSGVARTFHLSPHAQSRLDRAADTLMKNIDHIPAVFMHGDAGTWNVVSENERIAFLDWEAADPAGLPLWDVFYLARSSVLDRAWFRRLARRPPSLHRALVADRDLADAIASYCANLELASEFVAPLYIMCWAHRALKEVARLEVGHESRSHFFGLLRESVDDRADRRWNR
ncbi:MAG: hypothetical protein ABIO99_00695 [Candidatus Limnocylindria bacterium]